MGEFPRGFTHTKNAVSSLDALPDPLAAGAGPGKKLA